MHTRSIDSYWSRQYSWEKVSAKNGLSSPYKSLNYHAHDVDHASRTRSSVEGDVAVSAYLLSILTHASEPSSLSTITNVSAYTSNTSGNAYHTHKVYIIVRGSSVLGLRLAEQTTLDAQQLQEALSRIALGKPSGFAEVRSCQRPFEHTVTAVVLEYAISVGII